MLKIYNSLTQQKQLFTPIRPKKIHLYVCGMTVYDYCHIGHARSMIVFDMVVRYLQWLGYEVLYVRNITDIDDKIIQRAEENQESTMALTERFIQAMEEDAAQLHLQAPALQPRATTYIPQMLTFIDTLLDSGAAYVADNGDVYFDVRRFADYGKLSRHDVDKLKAGVRIELSHIKRDPLDFILWKQAKPGEPKWESPWGEGRPGWHTECAVMSADLLGQPFDIHGGGIDLKFPHHENEIAQAEMACKQPFANTWMHVGLVQVNQEKMSKSLGNYFTIREVLAQFSAETVRYFMLQSHYRSPVNYSPANLLQAQQALARLYIALLDLPVVPLDSSLSTLTVTTPVLMSYVEAWQATMDDDFNTPAAFAILFDIAHEVQRRREQGFCDEETNLLGSLLKYFGNIFGILQHEPQHFLQGSLSDEDSIQIEQLIAAREQARADKQWAQADQIRHQLQGLGVIIEDSATGTRWRRQL